MTVEQRRVVRLANGQVWCYDSNVEAQAPAHYADDDCPICHGSGRDANEVITVDYMKTNPVCECVMRNMEKSEDGEVSRNELEAGQSFVCSACGTENAVILNGVLNVPKDRIVRCKQCDAPLVKLIIRVEKQQ